MMSRHSLDILYIAGLLFIDTAYCRGFNALFWGRPQRHHELRVAAAAAAALLDGPAAAWPPCPTAA